MAFRFRLARVLEWYDRQYQTEAGRLRRCAEQSANAHADLASHRQSRLTAETQLLRLESLSGDDLRARETYHRWSLLQESHLVRMCHDADRNLETQREVTLAAQRRVRLVEKLRDRKRDEYDYLTSRDLEHVAADSWLAGFARSLNENRHG